MGYRIEISGPVEVRDQAGGAVTEGGALARLDGLRFGDEVVVDHLHDPVLSDLDLGGGALVLRYSTEEGLRVVTEFLAPRRVGKRPLGLLEEETRAQWSDGIGEGPTPDLVEELGWSLDLSPGGGEGAVRILQEKVAPAKKKRAAPRRIYGAIRKGDAAKVRAAIEKGEDLSGLKEGLTPLGWAVFQRQPEILTLLLEAGADPDQVDAQGDSPLLRCVLDSRTGDRESTEMARRLLEAGADARFCSRGGNDCLGSARDRKKRGLAALLEDHGARAFDVELRFRLAPGSKPPKYIGYSRTEWEHGRAFEFPRDGKLSLRDIPPGRYRLDCYTRILVEPPEFSVSEEGEVDHQDFLLSPEA